MSRAHVSSSKTPRRSRNQTANTEKAFYCGKQRIGKISKAGNKRLRQLLVVGAMAVIRFARPGSKSASAWLLQLLERKLAAVALANKMARVIWAMMARGEAYRRQPITA
ncbi:MAG: transposase [Janthinobacterium lividum]